MTTTDQTEFERIAALTIKANEAVAHELENGGDSHTCVVAAMGVFQPEIDRLKAEVQRLGDEVRMHMDIRLQVEKVLDEALGTEEEDGAGAGLVADVALLADRLKAVRDLHAPFRIYDDCCHEHEETDKGVTNVIEIGVVCEGGYMYTVCRHCCIDAEGFQTEECVSGHDHSREICPTRTAIDGATT